MVAKGKFWCWRLSEYSYLLLVLFLDSEVEDTWCLEGSLGILRKIRHLPSLLTQFLRLLLLLLLSRFSRVRLCASL